MRTTNRYELSGSLAIIRNAQRRTRKVRCEVDQDWKYGERPAPGREYKNRPATERGQCTEQPANTRWARIAVREHRRATFWREVLDAFKTRREA
jgi:hypothetical protein